MLVEWVMFVLDGTNATIVSQWNVVRYHTGVCRSEEAWLLRMGGGLGGGGGCGGGETWQGERQGNCAAALESNQQATYIGMGVGIGWPKSETSMGT